MLNTAASQESNDLWDNDVLDNWKIPFGQWIEEIVFWITGNLKWLLEAIKWPVDILLKLVVDNGLNRIPWLIVLLFFLLLGTATRNFLVGLGSAFALLICGLLGDDYWTLTMETVGMIVVSVVICAVFGIPLGILSARYEGFWNRLRPVLDGMQVVHPFVYLLPIIFLFGLRRTPGVLATLIFALPPIVRLTNLGIRQVPGDVVEAARAFGAKDRRILLEVQLPLARPAIMAGLNQTLLLSLSMVGIVAIIAGGGLGKPILTALNTADVPDGAAAGAGLYFVGVLLDRISQPETAAERKNLLTRIRQAWATRSDPVVPPTAESKAPETVELDDSDSVDENKKTTFAYAYILIAALGSLAAIVSCFMPWGSGAGKVSRFARYDDIDLAGQHSALSQTGGSWFAILVAFGAVGSLVALGLLLKKQSTTNIIKLSAALIAANCAMLGAVLSYITINSAGVENYTDEPAVWMALVGALTGTIVSLILGSQITAPQIPRPRQKSEIAIAVVFGLFAATAGALGGWILDQRSGSAELAAELAAQADGAQQGGVAAEILAEALAGTRRVTIRGLDDQGPQLGYMVIIISVLVIAVAVARYFANPRSRRTMSLLSSGLGSAMMAIAVGWIASIVRLDVNQLNPGASAFLTLCVGIVIANRGWRDALAVEQMESS